ncbi:transposase family protein [Streptomyces incanus]
MGDVFLQDLWFHQVEGVVIENAVVDGELVVVRARASAERAACPACGRVSGRVHSRYVRRLADTAVAGRPVLIELQVRRFRCRDRACRQCPCRIPHPRRWDRVSALAEADRVAGIARRRLAQHDDRSCCRDWRTWV